MTRQLTPTEIKVRAHARKMPKKRVGVGAAAIGSSPLGSGYGATAGGGFGTTPAIKPRTPPAPKAPAFGAPSPGFPNMMSNFQGPDPRLAQRQAAQRSTMPSPQQAIQSYTAQQPSNMMTNFRAPTPPPPSLYQSSPNMSNPGTVSAQGWPTPPQLTGTASSPGGYTSPQQAISNYSAQQNPFTQNPTTAQRSAPSPMTTMTGQQMSPGPTSAQQAISNYSAQQNPFTQNPTTMSQQPPRQTGGIDYAPGYTSAQQAITNYTNQQNHQTGGVDPMPGYDPHYASDPVMQPVNPAAGANPNAGIARAPGGTSIGGNGNPTSSGPNNGYPADPGEFMSAGGTMAYQTQGRAPIAPPPGVPSLGGQSPAPNRTPPPPQAGFSPAQGSNPIAPGHPDPMFTGENPRTGYGQPPGDPQTDPRYASDPTVNPVNPAAGHDPNLGTQRPPVLGTNVSDPNGTSGVNPFSGGIGGSGTSQGGTTAGTNPLPPAFNAESDPQLMSYMQELMQQAQQGNSGAIGAINQMQGAGSRDAALAAYNGFYGPAGRQSSGGGGNAAAAQQAFASNPFGMYAAGGQNPVNQPLIASNSATYSAGGQMPFSSGPGSAEWNANMEARQAELRATGQGQAVGSGGGGWDPGARWLGAGADAGPGEWTYDLGSGGGWTPPGSAQGGGGMRMAMGSGFDPATRGAGYHVLMSPPGQPAPRHLVNYTPATKEMHQAGSQAPVHQANLSLVPAGAFG